MKEKARWRKRERERNEIKSNNVMNHEFSGFRCEQLRFELAIFRYIFTIFTIPITKVHLYEFDVIAVCSFCCGCYCWFLAFTLCSVKIRTTCKQKATSKELYDMREEKKNKKWVTVLSKRKTTQKTKGQTYQIRTRPDQTKPNKLNTI